MNKLVEIIEIPAKTRLLALSTYLWHYASRKEAYVQCEKALFYMMIGDANGLSAEDIKQAIENTMEYSIWKKKVILFLSLLPNASSALKDWKNSIRRFDIYCACYGTSNEPPSLFKP